MKRTPYSAAFLLSVLCLAASCASTKVTSDWKDPSYQKRPGKVLVLALVDDMTQRRLLEDELAGQLGAEGIDAVPGYIVLPGARPDREAIQAQVRAAGADALFMTRIVDRKTVQEYVPGTPYYPPTAYYDWYNYYGGLYRPYPPGHLGYAPGGPYPPSYSPGYTVENVYYIAEANLYDASTAKLIWSARTESRLRGNDEREIRSYAGQIVKSLKKQGLIG